MLVVVYIPKIFDFISFVTLKIINVFDEVTDYFYLIFSGSWPSDESYVLTLSDVPECTALRVEPLDEKCRELNRCYILPVSYGKNNMFLINWNENDFGELNFYDLYDIFYQKDSDIFLQTSKLSKKISIGTFFSNPPKHT